LWAFNSNTLAESSDQTYVDGEYDVVANALEAKKDIPSVAADYINEDAKVTVKDGELELTVTVPKNDQFELYEMYKNGEEQIKTEDDDNIYYSFKLTEEDVENEMINIVTSYEVPFMNFVHENVDFRFQITGLDDIPVKDNEEIEDEEDSDSGDENESTDEEQGNDEDEGTDEEQGADEDEGTDEEQGADEDEGRDEEQGADEVEDTDEEQGADENEGKDEEQGADEDEGTDEEQGADEDEGTDEEQGADEDEGTDEEQGADEDEGTDEEQGADED